MGKVEFSTTGDGALVAGAARALGNLPLGSVVRFNFPGVGIAGVGVSRLVNAFMIPIVRDTQTSLSTGVAAFNAGPDDTMRFVLNRLDGTLHAETEVAIAGNGHLARFIHELFPNLGDFEGTLTVHGSPLAATAMQLGSGSGQFTTLPVVPTSPLPASTDLHFAQFANGDGFVSSLFLLNPSGSEAAQGQLAFFDDGGNALSMGVNGQAPAANIPFDIAPGGGGIFTTDGAGGLVVGSARAVLSQGVAGGVLRFSTPSVGITGVGSSLMVAGFLSPVRRDTATGLNTGLAIAATGTAVTVDLTLRDSLGGSVTDGVTQIQLAPDGHQAKFIDELFPLVDTTDFSGTITAVATAGSIVGTAIELGPGVFTTLPVTSFN